MRRFCLLLVAFPVLALAGTNMEGSLHAEAASIHSSDMVLPSPTSTLIPTMVPPPTEMPTQIPPTPVPTLSPEQIHCEVPLSFMLHWNDAGVLQGILDRIQAEGYVAITYQQWYWVSQQGTYDLSKAVILSFDDAGPSGIYSDLRLMIDYTNQRGFVGVVGVVMGELKPEEWSFLRELYSRGWEIANHSKTHPDAGLPSLREGPLREDISYVQQRVYENIGVYPQTLILPGGNYSNDRRIDRFCEEMGIQFIVGIATGGFNPWIQGPGPYYVGRAGIESNPWSYAMAVFNPK